MDTSQLGNKASRAGKKKFTDKKVVESTYENASTVQLSKTKKTDPGTL